VGRTQLLAYSLYIPHIFITRLGKTLLGHNFNVPWRAAKLETQTIGQCPKDYFYIWDISGYGQRQQDANFS
jgi:hypothetical protein